MKIRTYACQRLYLKADSFIKPAAIRIDEEGTVIKYMALTEELSATEWIGGIVFLSNEDSRIPACDFNGLLRWNSGHADENKKQYAWHISHFDFIHECLTPQSVIQRLCFQSVIVL